MLRKIKHHARFLKGSIVHPQWLSDRNHEAIRKKYLKLKNCNILNIGSGDTIYPTNFVNSNSLIQFDYPSTNRFYRNRPHVYGNATDLPFADCTFDVILFLEVLEHIPNDLSAIKEIQRTLKPGGQIYLSAPFIYPIHDSPHDYRRYTKFGLQTLLNNTGFKNISLKNYGNSFTTPLLLFNLAILNRLKMLDQMNSLLTLIVIPIAYSTCLIVNIVAALFLCLDNDDTACMGYFATAQKSPGRNVS